MKTKGLIISLIITLLLGIVIGRCSVEDKDPIIKYEKGDVIIDSIPYPVPYDSIQVEYKCLPRKADTLYLDGDTVFVQGDIDTAVVLADYLIKRLYNETLFDNDTLGSLNVETSVQCNRLGSITYEFNPITKEITTHKTPMITPFVMGSYNTQNYLGIGGGIIIKDMGFSAKYINNPFLNTTGWEFGVIKTF